MKIIKNDKSKMGVWMSGVFLMSALTCITMLSFLGQYRGQSGKVTPDGKERVIDLQPAVDEWVQKNSEKDLAITFYDLKNGVKMGEYNGNKKYKRPELIDFPLAYDAYSKFANRFFNADSELVDGKSRKDCVAAFFLEDDLNCREKTLRDAGAQILKTSMQSYYGMINSDLENYTTTDLVKLLGLMAAKNGFPDDLNKGLREVLMRGATGEMSKLKTVYPGANLSGRAGKGYMAAVISYGNDARLFGAVAIGDDFAIESAIKIGEKINK